MADSGAPADAVLTGWYGWPDVDTRSMDALTAISLGYRDVRRARRVREESGLFTADGEDLRPGPIRAVLDPASVTASALRRIHGVGEQTILKLAAALYRRGHQRLSWEAGIVFAPDQPDPVARVHRAILRLRDADPDFFRAALGDEESVAVLWLASSDYRAR